MSAGVVVMLSLLVESVSPLLSITVEEWYRGICVGERWKLDR